MARMTPALARYLDLLDQLCAEGRTLNHPPRLMARLPAARRVHAPRRSL